MTRRITVSRARGGATKDQILEKYGDVARFEREGAGGGGGRRL